MTERLFRQRKKPAENLQTPLRRADKRYMMSTSGKRLGTRASGIGGMETTTMTKTTMASPRKLRDGSWGIAVQGAVQVGATVTVRTAGGKEWQATISRVVWTGDGMSICATSSSSGGARSRSPQRGGSGRNARGTWTGCPCGSVEEYSRDSDCRQCQYDAE
jgi:hypothetical protein